MEYRFFKHQLFVHRQWVRQPWKPGRNYTRQPLIIQIGGKNFDQRNINGNGNAT